MQPTRSDRLRLAVAARVGALRHVPALFRLAWTTSRALTLGSIGLRLIRAAMPALMLYVAKLVVDAVVTGRSDLASATAAGDWLCEAVRLGSVSASHFPVLRQKQGNSMKIARFGVIGPEIARQYQALVGKFPAYWNREISRLQQGIFDAEQGSASA